MEIYVNDIYAAVGVFPVLAFLMTLPYLVYQYRKYNSIPFWKSLMFYLFLFYLLCAYFMVILPLPEARHATDPGAIVVAPQLVPFRFVGQFADAARVAGLSLFSPASWIAFLRQGDVYCTLFNVLLTLPLGMFLCYIFRAKWWQAILAGLGMSLFYEISQLTGLFGYYDYAFRMFDVDDLITNAFGCILGWLIMKPLAKHLPDFRRLSGEALTKGAWQAAFFRRLAAFAVDMTLAAVLTGLVVLAILGITGSIDRFVLLAIAMVAEGIFLMLVPTLFRGQTAGQRLVRLRTVRRNGQPAEPWRIVVRYGLFVWLFLMGPLWIIELMPYDPTMPLMVAVRAILAAIYGTWLMTVIVRAIRSFRGHPFLMLNGAVSDTTVMTDEEARVKRNLQRRLPGGLKGKSQKEAQVPEEAAKRETAEHQAVTNNGTPASKEADAEDAESLVAGPAGA